MVKPTSELGEIVRALDRREVGAVELLEAHLRRVDELDAEINAVVTVEAERARTEAQAIDNARAQGQSVGPLAGAPVTIKDALATEGIRSTGGARELRDFVPT